MENFICSIFESPVFYIILLCLLIISIHVGFNYGISYLYIFLIDKFLPSYFYLKYFLILILLMYHYFIFRVIVIRSIFIFQFSPQICLYGWRQDFINDYKEKVSEFIKSIEVLLNREKIFTGNEIKKITDFLNTFEEEFDLYDKLYNIVHANNGNNNNNVVRYKMSNKQINYYNVLKNINNLLKENDLRDKLKNIKENDQFVNSIKIEKNQDIISILTQLKTLINTNLLPIIEKYRANHYTIMSPAFIYNALFNDSLGSMSLCSLQFKKKFQDYLIEENYSPNGKIHYSLIINKKKSNKNNDVIINETNEIGTEQNLLINEKKNSRSLFKKWFLYFILEL